MKALKAKLSLEPYKSRGVILEGEPLGAEAIGLFFKLKLYPDVIVKLNVTEDIAVERLFLPPPQTVPRDALPAVVDEETGEETIPEPEEEAPLPEKDELIDGIKAEREAMVGTMDEMDEPLEAEGVPVIAINASRSFKIVSYHLHKALHKYTHTRAGLLASVQHVTRKEAADLVRAGHKAITSAQFKSPLRLLDAHETKRAPLSAITI